MPVESIARKAAPRDEVDFARTAFISDTHSTTGDNIAEVPVVIMALMPDCRWKGTSQNTVIIVPMKLLADLRAIPPCRQRVG